MTLSPGLFGRTFNPIQTEPPAKYRSQGKKIRLPEFKPVMFNWAGTMIELGPRVPMAAFVGAFQKFQVEISVKEARGLKGLSKRDHIEAFLQMPRIAAAWETATGRVPDEAAIDRFKDVFVPLNKCAAIKRADLVPGAAEMISLLSQQGTKVVLTTGHARSIVEPILPLAAAQICEPDNLVCSDDIITLNFQLRINIEN